MKNCSSLLVAIFVLFVARIQILPAYPIQEEKWPIAEHDGSFRWVTSQQALIGPHSAINLIPDKIHFYLFTQTEQNAVEIDMDNTETLVRSSFNSNHPTAFMIHGWRDIWTSGASEMLRKALFQNGTNVNFISVDWRVYSDFSAYIVSQNMCKQAGQIVAQFIDWMHDNAKLRFDTLTLYGHSMGSQVAGFTGKNVKRGRVQTIIGMDPALPLFPIDDPNGRLAATDAEYVETIHTNGGSWGFFDAIGQTAFYPNGGKKQPGCEDEVDGLCSHIKAFNFVIEALSAPERNNFHAVRCEKLEHVDERKCNQYDKMLRMADPSNSKKPRGIYYLETNSESPYSKGIPERANNISDEINSKHLS